MKKVISTRIETDLVAKARDGLIANGIEPSNCKKISQILRLTFLFGLVRISTDPTSPATPESQSLVNQKVTQKAPTSDLDLSDIIQKN